jgi:hypothetical protein
VAWHQLGHADILIPQTQPQSTLLQKPPGKIRFGPLATLPGADAYRCIVIHIVALSPSQSQCSEALYGYAISAHASGSQIVSNRSKRKEKAHNFSDYFFLKLGYLMQQ